MTLVELLFRSRLCRSLVQHNFDLSRISVALSESKGWARLLVVPELLSTLAGVSGYSLDELPLLLRQQGYQRTPLTRMLGTWLQDVIEREGGVRRYEAKFSSSSYALFPDLGFVAEIESSERPGSLKLYARQQAEPLILWLQLYARRQKGDTVWLEFQHVGPSKTLQGSLRWEDQHPGGELEEGSWAPALSALRPYVNAPGGESIVLFYGPSGSGKTHTALSCLHSFFPGTRALCISGRFLPVIGTEELAFLEHLLQIVKAHVLVFDDMSASATLRVLENLTRLQKIGVPVILTCMCDPATLSLPGLRPGRIQRMFAFGAPTLLEQRAILRRLAPDVPVDAWEVAKDTPGAAALTFDYIRAWAVRVQKGEPARDALLDLLKQFQIANGRGALEAQQDRADVPDIPDPDDE